MVLSYGLIGSLAAAEPSRATRLASGRRPEAARTAARVGDDRRRVEVRGEWFYVGGEPFLVKGIGYSPYRPGQAPWRDRVELSVMERDFRRIAEAGFNTLRTWSPLSGEALELAERHGLMVLQGIWIEHKGGYASEAFQQAMLSAVARETERAKGHANILALLIGNELMPEQAAQIGIPELEALLRRAALLVKTQDASRLVSYANWPTLALLETSMWDCAGFNLYPYAPASLAHTFGFRSYVEHLKKTAARGKPLVITEVGLSVSPQAGGRPGYGGLTPAAQQSGLLRLWDELFQAGAQGGVVFEWNDEWWKQGDGAEDAQTHDEADPEEWFGLVEFPSRQHLDGAPRPAYEALKAYNQAILLSPVSEERYQDRLPVTVYAVEGMAQIRVRIDRGKWSAATKLNRHWWKAQLQIDSEAAPGSHQVVMEAYDPAHRLLVRQERQITFGPLKSPVIVSVATDRSIYEVNHGVEPVRYTITVTDGSGAPLGNRLVSWSVSEPQADVELVQATLTDASGRIGGVYMVHEPGLVTLSAAAARDDEAATRRVGNERFFVVRLRPSLNHVPSVWEAAVPETVQQALRHEPPAFQLADPGVERVVDYARYGAFKDAGSPTYRYEVRDWEGLAAAVGEGVYPNGTGLSKDPAYHAAKRAGRLEGSHWDFTFAADPQLSFFKWAETDEEPGVKQFYTAMALERSGLWLQAVKAYYAVLVHFPASIGWTAFDPPTPWYVGKVARDKIEAILRLHPELGMRLQDARVVVENGFDNDVDNDVILTFPGALLSVTPEAVNLPPISSAAPRTTRELGRGRVRLAQDERGHWRLLIEGAPWTVRGLTYQPSAVGESPDEGTLRDWMTADRNHSGTVDALETFVDANRNDRQDSDEPTVGDFELLRAMGVNTIRLYHHAGDKALLRQLHERYGIMVLMGDLVGMYTVGSGARWEEGTDYLNATQRKRMLESVKQMVREFKNEPYVLMWVLGNENNYGGVHGIIGGKGNAAQHPVAYYRFLNELATWIHAEDPHHPVAIANGDLGFLDLIAKEAPAIDVFGANVYRGWHGVGRSFFEDVERWLDKPVLITEFGCPAYQLEASREAAERDQALYHFGSWVDVMDNMAGRGVGNAIGGVVFEWSDEWWKGGQPPRFSPVAQETQPNWAGPFPGGWNFEEWFGLVSQGGGTLSPFLRQLRVSYRLYQQLWAPDE